MSDKNIVLWSKEGCPKCAQIESFLNGHQLAYTSIDVEESESLRGVLEKKYGRRSVPVVEIGRDGQYRALFGADIDGLRALLEV